MNIIERNLNKDIFIEDLKVGDTVIVVGITEENRIRKEVFLGKEIIIEYISEIQCALNGVCNKVTCSTGLKCISFFYEGIRTGYACHFILANKKGQVYKSRYKLPEDYIFRK